MSSSISTIAVRVVSTATATATLFLLLNILLSDYWHNGNDKPGLRLPPLQQQQQQHLQQFQSPEIDEASIEAPGLNFFSSSSVLHPTIKQQRRHQQQNETDDGTSIAHISTELVCNNGNGPMSSIPYDPERHKPVYTVGVLAIRGFEAAYKEFNKTFADYLTITAGKRFDPPIRFEMKPLNFLTLFSDSKDGLVDYIYVNPSAYSCIESEYEAQSLVSQVSRRRINGEIYDLQKFGGVIATLSNRSDIKSIHDLRDKVIAAASISGLGSGQMQFKQMVDNGMNYLQDPKQLVFTSNQGLVVKGLLSGEFDVGFVRTDQLERSKDLSGNPVNIADFRIIDPKPNLSIDGIPFPFESSTELYAEWNIAALTHVAVDVSREVQQAMLNVAEYSGIGKVIQEEYPKGNATCESMDLKQFLPLENNPGGGGDMNNSSSSSTVQCGVTKEVAIAANEALVNGKYAGWTTSLSYMQLRSMQEATGFISMEPTTKVWRCIRSAEIYDAISCPAGYDKKSKNMVNVGCEIAGLSCDDNFQCVCRPCETPYELICVDSVRIGEGCVSLLIVLPSIIIPLLLVAGIFVHFYVDYKRKQADSVWVVEPDELLFGDPPTCIGRGSFGLVLLAEYRGTRVAVKRVIPPGANSATLFDSIMSFGRGKGGSQGTRSARGNNSVKSFISSCSSNHKTHKVDTTDEDDNTRNNGTKTTRFSVSSSPNHHYYPGDRITDHERRTNRKLKKERGLNSTGLQSAVMAYSHTRSQRQQEQQQYGIFRWCWNSIKAKGNNKKQLQMKTEFVSEIRQLARLRHPCITTVMVSSSCSGNQTATALSITTPIPLMYSLFWYYFANVIH